MFYLWRYGTDEAGCECEECLDHDEDRQVLEETATRYDEETWINTGE